MTGALVVKRAALVLLGTGSLLLAFVAYQLWGTALYEHSAQARLHQQLAKTLHTTGTLPTLPSHPTTTDPGAPAPVSKAAPTTADPGVGSAVGLISIPSIGLSQVAIVEGTGENQLQQGPGHYPGTPLPGQAGNAAIAGHRTTYGAPFYSLDGLHSGDAINVETPQGIFQYQVVQTKVVSPDDTSVIQPTLLPELTLTTCNPRYSSSQRLVVQALLHTSVINESFKPGTSGSGTSGSGTSGASGGSGSSSGGSSPPSSLAGGSEQESAGSNVRGGVVGAVLWGIGVIAAAVGARLAYSRLRGRRRLLSVPAVLVGLLFLLFCFQHVSLALPASF